MNRPARRRQKREAKRAEAQYFRPGLVVSVITPDAAGERRVQAIRQELEKLLADPLLAPDMRPTLEEELAEVKALQLVVASLDQPVPQECH